MQSKNRSLGNMVWSGLFFILMLLGFATWIYQLNAGLVSTGMSNPVSWGLYIIVFAFLVGLSAGGLIVSALAYILKNERLEKIAPLGVVVAVACVIGAMAMIIPDVGHPEKVFNILFSGNVASPLFWDIVILFTYLIIGLVELWLIVRGTAHAKLRWMAYLILPVAILVHSVTAWIFGLQVGRPFWFTGLLAPIFISSALVSGLGLLLLVMLAVRRKFEIPDDTFSYLGGLLAAFIALDAFLLFSELVTLTYARGIEEFTIANLMLTGPFAVFFWIEVLAGVLLPFVILLVPSLRRSPMWVSVAGLLAMFGVLLKRVNIIAPSFQHLNIDYAPGVSTGRLVELAGPFTNQPVYSPTWVEYMIVIGVLGGVAFLITVGVAVLTAPAPEKKAVRAQVGA
jgi:dimethyl sulfoxide reductase membrane subunit